MNMTKFLTLKTWHKVIFAVFLCIAVILFAAPRIACKYIVNHSTELIGRKLDMDKIRINYFTGTLRIYNLKLYENHSSTSVFLSFKKFRINLSYLPLLKNEIYVTSVSLDDPYLQVLQDGDHFNFSDLIASDSTKTEEDTTTGLGLKYVISNIRISSGYVKYTDIPLDNTIALNKVDLAIPGFTWNSESTNLAVDFRFVGGGSLYSKLTLNQADSTYQMHLILDDLNMDVIQPYVTSNLNVSALHGYLTNDITIQGSMQHVMQLFVKGINHISNFELIDLQKRKMLAFQDLTVDIDTFLLDKNRIVLNKISLTNPFVLVEMIDSVNNWITLMKPGAEETTDSSSQQAAASSGTGAGYFSFASFTITGGMVHYIDKTLRYPFEYTIDNVKLESSPIAGPGEKLAMHIDAMLNKTGKFNFNATFNPYDMTEMTLKVAVNQFHMKDVDAYFKHYFGFPVTGGIMNFTTDNKMGEKYLKSNNSMYFRKFTLGNRLKDKTAYSIPLRLALGVLSDKDGIIDLKAPVEMKGEDLEVEHLGRIVFRIIGNLFVKAATSPFSLLADMYHTNPENLKEVKLTWFDAMPDKKNMENIDLLADVLSKRPALNIQFYYWLNYPKAADTLAYLMTLDHYRTSQNIHSNSIPDSILTSYLHGRSLTAGNPATTSLAGLCRAYIGEARIHARLDSVKTLQTEFLSNYLSQEKGIPVERFEILDPPADTMRSAASINSFIICFKGQDESASK
jgi:uncharacterized protein involved in outer membrane biogenesis